MAFKFRRLEVATNKIQVAGYIAILGALVWITPIIFSTATDISKRSQDFLSSTGLVLLGISIVWILFFSRNVNDQTIRTILIAVEAIIFVGFAYLTWSLFGFFTV